MIAPSVDLASALGALTNLADLAGRLRPGGETCLTAPVDQAVKVDAASEGQPGETLTAEQERRARIALQRLDTFMRTTRKKAINFARRFFPDSLDDCEDVVQQAAMKVVRRAWTYDPRQPFETWYFQILANAAIDRRRTVLRAPLILSYCDPAIERMLEDTEGGNVEEEVFADITIRDTKDNVHEVLAHMDGEDAALLMAVHGHGLRPNSILGRTDGSVMTSVEDRFRREYAALKSS